MNSFNLQQGDECQTEEVEDENKSLIWALVKQVDSIYFRALAFDIEMNCLTSQNDAVLQ